MAPHRIALLAFLAAHLCAFAPVLASEKEPRLTPLVAKVLSPPMPVPASDGRRHLVYELGLANGTGGNADIETIDVLDRMTGRVLLTLGRDDIAKRLSLGGRRGAESARLGVAQFGVVFMHLALAAGDPMPQGLSHRITVRLDPPGIDFTMTIAETKLDDRLPVVLAPPLLGKNYLVGDGCCDTIRHVRALLALDGHFALAQRFAIDWEQADPQDRLVHGDPRVLENYTIFGKDIFAVGDGTVLASRNDLPEQVPGSLPAGLPLDEADGNFIVQHIGAVYVLYAHLQPGSVTVKAGDEVRRGDRLGKVGNTGNSQAPHLHLHVMDGPSPLLSNGLPYVFDEFAATAVDEAGTADFDRAEATGSPLTLTRIAPPRTHRKVLPLDLTIVEFSR